MSYFRFFLLFSLFITVCTVLFVMPFGMRTMNHQEAIPMINCPFMFDKGELCMMSILEHIVSWQQLITMVIHDVSFLFLVLLFFVATLTTVAVCLGICTKWFTRIRVFLFPHSLLLFGTSLFPRAP